MSLDFKKFNVGTLFLVRTPEVWYDGYADKCMKDMKDMHFDFVAHLETWNCNDGVLWKSDKYPRSSFWEGDERDPMEECFAAADKYDLAFLPEAGMTHKAYILENEDAMFTSYTGEKSKYGRIGLSPACPQILEYLTDKYDALYEKFGHHKSFQGFCLPSENSGSISYDKYSKEAWKKRYGTELPTPDELREDTELERKVIAFFEDNFVNLYQKLSAHLKEKYGLPLMQYPLSKISHMAYHQPTSVFMSNNLSLMCRVDELDMLNLQLHPPLNPNPYFHKFETDFLMAAAKGKPCMADTHFYHEGAAGRLPDTTPKRIMDSILSTLTPYGISFFCYGFMAEELPPWKKELNPGAPVFRAYDEENTVAARRKMAKEAMEYVHLLRPIMENTEKEADCAVYYPENADKINHYYCYPFEHLFGVYELFGAVSLPSKVVSQIPESADEQKMIVISSLREIEDDECKRLEKYLASGGRLIVIGKCSEKIEKIAGISTALSDAKFVKSETSRDYKGCFIRMPDDTKHYTEKNGEVIMRYDDDTPAVTKCGNVLFIGFSDEIDRFPFYRDHKLASWWKEYFTGEGLASGVEFHNEYSHCADRHQFTSFDIFGNDERKLLLGLNFGVEHHKSSLSWDVPKGYKLTAAYCDGEKFDFENGKELPIFEHFMALIAEKEN